jgi:hypothetical protein
MSRGWFLKSCRDYSTKFNCRLRTVRVNFVRTHHVRRIKAYDQQQQVLLSRVLCPSVRGNQRGKDTFTAWACSIVAVFVGIQELNAPRGVFILCFTGNPGVLRVNCAFNRQRYFTFRYTFKT